MIISLLQFYRYKNCVPVFRVGCFCLTVVLISGCSSIFDARKQKSPYMKLYFNGEVKTAAEDLSEKSEDRRDTGDELVWRLDEGSAFFTAGRYDKSLVAFRRCEKLIKEFDKRAVVNVRAAGAETGVAFTNLNALPYQGLCSDRIMLNAYKALDYFALKDTSAALVELRRMRYTQKNVVRRFEQEITEKQREIDEYNRKNNRQSRSLGQGDSSVSFDSIVKNDTVQRVYNQSKLKSNYLYGNFANPFATYLSAIGYLIENNYGEALVDFRNLYRIDKQNKLFQRDFVTTAKAVGSSVPDELKNVPRFNYPLDKKIVYVIFFNGRAPALKQVKFQIVLPFVGYSGIAFPKYEYFPAPFSGIEATYIINGNEERLESCQIADFDAILSQEYHQRMPAMITRIVISMLTKQLASAVAVYAARSGGGTAGMLGAYAVTGVYKYLFNTADTRCWESLPKEVQVIHFPMPDDGKVSFLPVNKKVTTKKQVKNPEPVKEAEPVKSFKFQKKNEIVLQKDRDITIIYIRALSTKTVIYKVFEINSQ